jgi:hypothetical protein
MSREGSHPDWSLRSLGALTASRVLMMPQQPSSNTDIVRALYAAFSRQEFFDTYGAGEAFRPGAV